MCRLAGSKIHILALRHSRTTAGGCLRAGPVGHLVEAVLHSTSPWRGGVQKHSAAAAGAVASSSLLPFWCCTSCCGVVTFILMDLLAAVMLAGDVRGSSR